MELEEKIAYGIGIPLSAIGSWTLYEAAQNKAAVNEIFSLRTELGVFIDSLNEAVPSIKENINSRFYSDFYVANPQLKHIEFSTWSEARNYSFNPAVAEILIKKYTLEYKNFEKSVKDEFKRIYTRAMNNSTSSLARNTMQNHLESVKSSSFRNLDDYISYEIVEAPRTGIFQDNASVYGFSGAVFSGLGVLLVGMGIFKSIKNYFNDRNKK